MRSFVYPPLEDMAEVGFLKPELLDETIDHVVPVFDFIKGEELAHIRGLIDLPVARNVQHMRHEDVGVWSLVEMRALVKRRAVEPPEHVHDLSAILDVRVAVLLEFLAQELAEAAKNEHVGDTTLRESSLVHVADPGLDILLLDDRGVDEAALRFLDSNRGHHLTSMVVAFDRLVSALDRKGDVAAVK